jgi:hypothetical protein
VVIAYEKRGIAENYIKEAKYDMAVGHLLLQSFWANEAIFQLMMMTYNLLLLFKMDFAKRTEYRQQIKTFRLKYIFLAGKIIRTARSVVMKLSENYPCREIYEKSRPEKTHFFIFQSVVCILSRTGKKVSGIQFYENGMPNIMQNGGNYAKVKRVTPQSTPVRGESVGKIYSTWIFGCCN